MTISESVNELIDLIDRYSRGKLRDRNMLATILQLAGDAGMPELVGDLAFHGKYLARLFRALRREELEPEVREKIETEFVEATTAFRKLLESLLPHAEGETRAMFERHFISLTPDTVPHLVALAEDFSCLKNWELEMRDGEQENAESDA